MRCLHCDVCEAWTQDNDMDGWWKISPVIVDGPFERGSIKHCCPDCIQSILDQFPEGEKE